jgi:hypothetical protein
MMWVLRYWGLLLQVGCHDRQQVVTAADVKVACMGGARPGRGGGRRRGECMLWAFPKGQIACTGRGTWEQEGWVLKACRCGCWV